MGKEFDLTGDPRKGNKFGFSPALLVQVQKYVPTAVIRAVSEWTRGEPELTQGIFKLLLKHYIDTEYTATNLILSKKEVAWFEGFIKSVIIPKWQTISELTSLRDIETCFLNNPNVEPFWLLKEYQQILQNKLVPKNNSREQKELLSFELVVLENGNLRVYNPIYEAIFNNNWIEGHLKSLSPYQLTLYRLESKSDSASRVLEEILFWTNGHLFLTKKICDLVNKLPGFIKTNEETVKIKNIVQRHIIKNWERNLAAEYLKPIRDRLLNSDRKTGFQLLKLYRQVLLGKVDPDRSSEQQQLLDLGLLDIKARKLVVYNPIYREVFNLDWVEKELVKNVIESSNLERGINANKKNIFKQNKTILIVGLSLIVAGAIGLGIYKGMKIINPEIIQQNQQENTN